MKKIYYLLVFLLFFSVGISAQSVKYYSKAAATDFTDVNSWGIVADGTGVSPASITNADTFVVANNSALNLNTANASVKQLTITLGSLTIGSNTLTVSNATGNNSSLLINGGTLNVSATGTIILNGNFLMSSGGLTQTGGQITVDANDNNTAASSTLSGVHLFSLSGTINCTAGNITIVDPPLNTLAIQTTRSLVISSTASNTAFGGTHSFTLGDGISTTPGNTDGFTVETYASGAVPLQNLICNGGNAAGRYGTTSFNSSTLWGTHLKGTLTVNAGSEFRVNPNSTSANQWVVGSIINNGIVTTGRTTGQPVLTFGTNSTLGFVPTVASSISGSGVFRNLVTTPTASFGSMTFNNVAGINFSSPTLTFPAGGTGNVSGTLAFTAGRISLAGQTFVMGTTGAAGTTTYTAGGFVSGSTFSRNWATGGTGSAITAATDPTSVTSRYPFVTSTNIARSAWIERAAAGGTGTIAIQYNEVSGITPVTVTDGSYNITYRSNDSWVVSGTSASSCELAIVAPGVYSAPDAGTRILLASAVSGTYQGGTITPGGQRVLTPALLANTYYLGMNLPACTGTPIAGTSTISSTTVCNGSTTNLNTTGGSTELGITYQWQSSPAGANTFTDISGASTKAYTATVTANTDFKCVVTCSNSGLSATSTIVTATLLSFSTVTTVATPTIYYIGSSITVSLTGLAVGPTYTYQWQNNISGAGFNNIAGATSATYATPPITAVSTSYQCIITTCTGTLTTTSTVFVVTPTAGYCVPSTTTQISWISAFSTTGGVTNITHSAAAGATGGYINLTATSVSNYLGQTTNFSVTAGGPTVGFAIWVDWNNNSDFETTERVFVTTAYSTTSTGTIAIPALTANGNYRMRVFTDYNNSAPSNPCATGVTRGEYKDFTFAVVDAPSCNAPTALAVAASPAVTTTTGTVTFTASTSAPANGYDYYISTTNTPPLAATTATGTVAASPLALTGLTPFSNNYVWIRSNCGGPAGKSAWAGPVNILTSYCTPAPSSVDANGITNVTFGTINNTTVAEAGNYGNYSAQSSTHQQGTTVPVAITYSTGYTYGTKIWIDYNDDLDFLDVGELVYTGLSAATNPTTLSASISISGTATIGAHRLRIGGTDDDAGPSDPCYTGTYGTFEDYTINITAGTPCSGAPAGVAISPIATTICGTGGATFTATTTSTGIGITYVWESSPAGANTWTVISAATTNTYVATGISISTDYHCILTCSGSSTTSPTATTIIGTVPVNDNCAAAITVFQKPNAPTCSSTTSVNTSCATLSTNTSASWITSQDDDVWYKFQATATSGSINISNVVYTSGVAVNIGMSIYNDTSNCANVNTAHELSTTLVPPTIIITSGAGIGNISGLVIGDWYTIRLLTGGTSSRASFDFCLMEPPAVVPDCATALLPVNGATNVTTIPSLTLSWTPATTGGPVSSYDVYISATTPIPATTTPINSTTASLPLVGFAANTAYYWYVVPKNGAGPAVGCTTQQSFTTSPVCNPFTTNGGASGDALTDFVLNGETATAISVVAASPIASPGYINLTATTTVNLAAGKAYAGNFKAQDANDYLTIWIDFNNNNAFEASEIVLNHLKPLSANTTTAYSILIPTGASVGTHKMRVRDIFSSAAPTGSFDPCAAYTYGEGKDFTVNIVATGAPYAVSSIGAGACADIAQTTIDAASNNTSVLVPLLDAAGAIVAQLNTNGNDLGTITSSIYRNTGAVRQVGAGFYLDRNITITPATQPTSAVNVRLYYTAAELLALQGVDAAATSGNMTSTKTPAACSNTFSGLPVSLSHGADGSLGSGYYLDVQTPSFSTFYMKGGSGALPVSIEFFKGTKQSSANYLDWKITCTSAPSLTISLERSADGRSFKSINEENALAVRCLQAFDYTDASPLAGANYYRLKLTTPTGEVSYSKIVVLLNKEKGFELISIAPNPVKNTAILTLTTIKGGKIDIAVSDVTGKIVAKQILTVIAGNNPVNMDFASLGAGTYMITAINADGEIKTTRFVKY
jgi:hypothetical protein